MQFVVGLLKGMGVADAHLVGSSLGGLIAGRTAMAHPVRVRSLTLVGSAGLGRHIAWSERLMTLPGVSELFFRSTEGQVRRMLRLLIRRGRVADDLAAALFADSQTPGMLRQMLAALREGVSLRGVKTTAQLLPALAPGGVRRWCCGGARIRCFQCARPAKRGRRSARRAWCCRARGTGRTRRRTMRSTSVC